VNQEKRLMQIIEAVGEKIADQKLKTLEAAGMLDISIQHYRYIDTLARLGSPTFSELAVAMGITKPAVTAVVNRLIRENIIYKEQSASDRRTYHIHLTPEGRRVAEAYQEAGMQYVKQVRKALSDREFRRLIELMGKTLG
jgi:DNA-binding MarR family transcriptional regulator